MLNLYEILKEVLNESVSSDSVNDAINNKYRILINYDDEDNHATGTRLVEPYVLGYTSNLEAYKENKEILYNELIKYGYEVIKPEGAFYMFVKAFGNNSIEFCEKADEASKFVYKTLTNNMKDEIQNLTKDKFIKIQWKEDEFVDIKLDSNYELSIINKTGDIEKPGDLSDGEKL